VDPITLASVVELDAEFAAMEQDSPDYVDGSTSIGAVALASSSPTMYDNMAYEDAAYGNAPMEYTDYSINSVWSGDEPGDTFTGAVFPRLWCQFG
jgi:hypothetical protein